MPQDFNLDQFKNTYIEECQELLVAAEEYLAELATRLDAVDEETLHGVFRCIHSIKGGAGTFNFTALVEFSHAFETVLDLLRARKIPLDRTLADLLVRANDVMADLVGAAQANEDLPDSHYRSVLESLKAYSRPKPVEGAIKGDPVVIKYNKTPEEEEEQGWGLFVENFNLISPEEDPLPEVEKTDEEQTQKLEAKPETTEAPRKKTKGPSKKKTQSPKPSSRNKTAQAVTKHIYRIIFVPDLHLLRFANEPLLLVREMKGLGQLDVKADISYLPSIEDINPEDAYLSWEYILRTDVSVQQVEEVFEFVIDDCTLSIELIKESDLKEPSKESIVQESVSEEEPAPTIEDFKHQNEPQDVPEVAAAVKEKSLPPEVDESKDVATKSAEKTVSQTPTNEVREATVGGGATVSSIRVNLDKVDRLVNMVGELVITQSMLRQQAEDLAEDQGQSMISGFDTLSSHTRELQESVMAIRMQPVKSVFSRIPRLVRELSARLNKEVDLITTGEMTEVDKTVIEQLMDPLTHMIRNSIDHGIETPKERLSAGKSQRGKIHLSCEHRSGRILIEVSDDGRGINREKVLEKAIERGVVSPEENLSDSDIDNLIFEPGFTTAAALSDVSGRGVGMDVVRRNIVSLGGRISVFSTPGQGSRFLMSLPLTLAVLDGMIVRTGSEKYIVPLTAVIETVHPMAEEVKTLVNGSKVLVFHERYIRLISLASIFNLQGAVEAAEDGLVVIVETERYGMVGLLIDDLLGQQQVVIKSLEENYDPIAGISAATILGNGKVALILDVEGLAKIEHKGYQTGPSLSASQKTLMIGG